MGMLELAATTLIAFAAPAPVAAASGSGYVFPVNVPAGSLASALQDLARQTGIELLFDRTLVRGFRAPAIKGQRSVDAALRELLRDTNLTVRRAASGAWLIEPRSAPDNTPPEDLAEPDILVTGRRTQNVDIRRRENDVQPYQVSTGEQIVRAHRNDLDQFFRSRVTANTQIVPPSLAKNGETNSQIDLRGLGPNQTLVLVDGRRLPSTPQGAYDFLQPDINAIPLHAIERVETLTGTASGIYGFGALGGVVNVVLRRDYHGLELHGSAGLSVRGDAGRLSLEGGIGFTPDHGDTDVMLYASRAWESPLLEGQRGYTLRGREIANRLVPDDVSSRYTTIQSNSINVFANGFGDTNLIFKPEFGGAILPSDHSFLPRGFAGTSTDMVAALTQNAGRLDLTPSDDMNASELGSTPTTTSLILNVRHRFGGGVEGYFDALILRNRGRNRDFSADGDVVFYPDSPLNPFENTIWVTFPPLTAPRQSKASFSSDRYTGGVIVPLPHDWKAIAEATFGAVRYDISGGTTGYYSFVPGFDEPSFNPFGNWEQFQRDLAPYRLSASSSFQTYNRYREQSLRLAGPLLRTAAGSSTLTLLFQNRNEKIPTATRQITADLYDPPTFYSSTSGRSSATRSAYAEIDAPLISETARIPLLKGLALQLAVRRDDQSVRFWANPTEPDPADALRARFTGTTFTAGAKFLPFPWLMLRGSYATGQQPPELDNLIEDEQVSYSLLRPDPRRGDAYFIDDGEYLVKQYGSPDLETVHADTLSLGMVINPQGDHGPRLSFDYSHIRRTGDYMSLSEDVVLEHEDLWPERVTREPLTDADRALGYTGGRITAIDARGMNAAKLDVKSIDARLDWTLPFAGGMLHGYGTTTWQLRNVQQKLFEAPEERAGYSSGPLKWRANGGAEWTIGPTMIGANLQYFARYRLAYSDAVLCCYEHSEQVQGSKYVKAQTYLDLYASRRFRVRWGGRDSEVSVDLGIVNIFDAAPPYQNSGSYDVSMSSFYGDPRQRRVELTLNSSF
jgi:iron complex outermembrane receptor protein